MSTIAHLSVAVSARVEALEKGFKKAQQTIDQLKTKITTLQKTNSQLKNSFSGAQDKIKGLRDRMAELQKVSFNNLNQGFTNLRGSLSGMLGPLGRVAAGISGIFLAKTAIGGAMELEKMQIQFAGLAGGADNAKAHLQELRDWSVSTPFQFMDIANASRTLLGFGMTTAQVMPMLQMLGDVSAGAGVDLSRLARQMGEISAKGKADMVDLKQLIIAGVPIWKLLGEHTGKTTEELQKMSSQGLLSIELINGALQQSTEIGGMYHEQTQAQSETTSGRISTLKDKFMDLMMTIGEKLKPVIDVLIETMIKAVEWVKSWDTKTVKMIAIIGGWVLAITGAIVVIRKIINIIKNLSAVYKMLTSAQIVQKAMSGPGGWAVLAAGATIATASVMALNAQYDEWNGSLEKTEDGLKHQEQAQAAVNDATAQAVQKEEEITEAQKARAKVMDKLKQKGAEVAKAMRTPAEKFADRIAELNELLDTGSVSWETYNRAVAKATESLHNSNKEQAKKNQVERRNVGAVTRRSVAAFSASNKSDSNWRKQFNMQQQQLASQQQANQIMQQVATNTSNLVSFQPTSASVP